MKRTMRAKTSKIPTLRARYGRAPVYTLAMDIVQTDSSGQKLFVIKRDVYFMMYDLKVNDHSNASQ
jgi:hypothetical protein